MGRLGRKFAGRKGTLQDVVSLYYFVLQLPRLLAVLRGHEARSE